MAIAEQYLPFDFNRVRPASCLQQAHDRQRSDRFTGAGFADQGKGFAVTHGK
jgi:hypothetical protein